MNTEDEEFARIEREIARRLAEQPARHPLELKLQQSEDEKNQIYRLLAMSHLNLRQHLQYGFSTNTARSTLISVGKYYPNLKAEMDRQEAAHGIKEKNI